MSPIDLLSFVSFLLTEKADVVDLDDLPADLGDEFVDKFGFDQLEQKLTSQRKKISHWRTMDAVATLERIKEHLTRELHKSNEGSV